MIINYKYIERKTHKYIYSFSIYLTKYESTRKNRSEKTSQ